MPKEYTREQTRIAVALGETFVVALQANPTTGYAWESEFDPAALTLLGREVSPPGPGIGRGGVERLRFMATAAGPTRLALGYRRAWESTPIDRVVFEVGVK